MFVAGEKNDAAAQTLFCVLFCILVRRLAVGGCGGVCQDGPHARTDGGRSADTERQTYLYETGMKRVWRGWLPAGWLV
jgi:hypothetical protein